MLAKYRHCMHRAMQIILYGIGILHTWRTYGPTTVGLEGCSRCSNGTVYMTVVGLPDRKTSAEMSWIGSSRLTNVSAVATASNLEVLAVPLICSRKSCCKICGLAGYGIGNEAPGNQTIGGCTIAQGILS